MIMGMENPFTIKSYESKELFCDREEELQLMLRNCINNTDMTLISKRRMGKTGLILRLFDELKDVRPDIHTIYFDIFASRNIDDFIKLFQSLPQVDAGLAASIFHFGEVRINDLKKKMAESGIPARITESNYA